jgi:hypothetical protein
MAAVISALRGAADLAVHKGPPGPIGQQPSWLGFDPSSIMRYHGKKSWSQVTVPHILLWGGYFYQKCKSTKKIQDKGQIL